MTSNLLYLISAAVIIAVIFIGTMISRRRKRRDSFPPFTQALTLMMSGDNPKALTILRDMIKEDTENVEAYILYGDILRKEGFHKQAAKIHKELTVRENIKSDLMASIRRSLLQDYLDGKMYPQALDCADHLLRKGGADLWTLERQLSALEAVGDWKRAAETAQRIQTVTNRPDREILSLYKTMEGLAVLEGDGKEHDARLKFRDALKIEQQFAMPYLELAESYLREKKTEDALKAWKQLFERNPHQAYLAFDRLESTLFELNRFAEVEKIYRRIVERDPNNSRAVAALSKYLDRKGETEAAIKICQEGLELQPESLWLRRNLFRYLSMEKRYKEASDVGLEVIQMVTKEKHDYECVNCHYISEKPLWKCPVCGKWRTFNY